MVNRINTEKNNNIYEIGISVQSILNLNKEQMNKLYNKINEVNVSTLIFDNLNLYEIEKYRQIEIDTVSKFLEKNNSEISNKIIIIVITYMTNIYESRDKKWILN